MTMWPQKELFGTELVWLLIYNRRPPDEGMQMSDIWAPELHIVDNYWWVYFSAANPDQGNPSHRMYVLRGPHMSSDPMEPTSKFSLEGQIQGLPDHWAIDGTVMHIDNVLYMVYSGWPLNVNDDLIQQLFITKMVDPSTADPSTEVHMISAPDYPWEKFKDPGDGPWHDINEGPQWLELGSFKGIIFSAGASWTSGYQLGILQYLGGDPFQISSWKKYDQPLLCNNPNGTGPYGPGHCSYPPRP
jgi:GH43 family beta-xylosidase